MEENTRKGRSSRMRKEVVGCFHYVVGNNRFLVQLEDRNKNQIISCLIVFLSSKEEVEMDDPLTNSTKK